MEKAKKIYQTEQRKLLLQFLQEHKTEQYSIDEIVSKLTGEKVPGKSTVYRLTKQLVEDGLVKRCNKGNSRQFTYQLLDGECCNHHFHMQCENCGKLIHLEEQETKKIQHFLEQMEDFDLDVGKSMLYGRCKQCH